MWCYNKAMEINPNNADSWNYRGVALYYLNKNKEAIESFNKAIDINPNQNRAWHNKGIVFQNA